MAAAVHLALVLHTASVHSATYDEVVYPTSGYAYLTTGDYRMNPEHPPFLKLLQGASWAGTGLSARSTPGWVETDQWRFGREMLYRGGAPPEKLLFRARAVSAVLSTVLLIVLALAAFRIGGAAAGIIAAGLYALDPLAIAHAGLATTDTGSALLYFSAAILLPGAILRGGWPRTVASGVVLGLALASKFSMLPLIVLAVLIAAIGPRMHRTGSGNAGVWPRLAVILLVAAVCLTLTYGLEGPGRYLHGLWLQLFHEKVGHPAYAFGLHSDSGWWWYFPAAWTVKTPLPILLLTFSGLTAVLVRFRRRPVFHAVLLAAPVMLAAGAVFSSLNIGVRHLLPVTPFLAVAAGIGASVLWKSRRWTRFAVAGLAVWLALATGLSHPHQLSYGNELIGGPGNTWRHLADSNVDWGQDLPAVAEIVRKAPLRRLYLSYFGTADPAASGLTYVRIPGMGMAERRFEDGEDPGGREWLAVSITNLHGVYTVKKDAYAWLRERTMAGLAGGSIAMWEITGDAAAHRELGLTALRFGDAEQALRPLERAIELDGSDRRARHELVRTYAALSRWGEALGECAILEQVETVDLCSRIREAAGTAETQ